jgi:hypothetical protein
MNGYGGGTSELSPHLAGQLPGPSAALVVV